MKLTTTKIFIGAAVIVTLILAIGVYQTYLSRPDEIYTYVEAKKGDIKESVRANGLVKPAEEVKLAFDRSGRITASNFKVGDEVGAGQVLASLANTDTIAQLSQARSSVQSAQAALDASQAGKESQTARLNDLINGAKPEDIGVSEAAVENAQQALSDAETNLKNVGTKADSDLNSLYIKTKDYLNDAYAKAFDAVNTKTSLMFSDSQTDSPKLTFLVTDLSLKDRIENERALSNRELETMKSEISNLGSDQSAIDNAVQSYLQSLNKIINFLSTLNEGLNLAVISDTYPQTTIDTFRLNINTALSTLNASVSSLNVQQQAIVTQRATNQNLITIAQTQVNQAKSALELAQKQLVLKQSGATGDQIKAQEEVVNQARAEVSTRDAALNSAKASVLYYQSQLDKTIIRAPIDGIITQQDAKVGEVATPNSPIVSLISKASFQIEVMLPEENIAKVSIGQPALVTLDAYGKDTVFDAKVILVYPSEIIINGAPNYRVTLEFDEESDLIKDGLTANVEIITGSKQDVIVVPKLSVFSQNRDNYVMVQSNPLPELRKVTVGLRQDGAVEIISGLEPGEMIVDFGSAAQD